MALRTVRRTAQGIWVGRHGLVRGLETFSLPELPYDQSALELVITTEVMELHHLQHHQSYVNNYNKALETLNHALTVGDSPTIIWLHKDIEFNGEGHINHSIFWKNVSPIKDFGGVPPKDSLASAINTQFRSLEGLTQKVNAEASDLLGSGWVWLALDKRQKKLSIETTENEHHNVKAKYLKYIWNIMNWKYVSEVYEKVCP